MRIIMHMDMDAFFASIEERENPKLKGKPIVVGADPKGGHGRGVVSTANYEARKYGIRSAMPISQTWKLCPSPPAAYLPVDGMLYSIVSKRIMSLVRNTVGEMPVEQVSIDEAFVDSSPCGSYERAQVLAIGLQREIFKQERLTCSIGIGPNKLIAKIASDFKKPSGLTIVPPERVQEFLDPLPVRRLYGIGPKLNQELKRKGIETVMDLRIATLPQSELGEKASGIDTGEVVEQYEAKSIGREITFERDTNDEALLTRTILELVHTVSKEAQVEQACFKTVTVRVRFDNFETHTSCHTLPQFQSSDTILAHEALKLLFPYFRTKRKIRLIGVRVSNFERR